MNKRGFVIVGGVVGAAVAWAVFRPELLFINKSVNELFPVALKGASAGDMNMVPQDPAAEVVASGMFHGVAHETAGMASIHLLSGGRRVLRLTGFKTSNGPDLRVLLVAASNASDSATVRNGKPVELGALKGNIGDQNYEVPLDLNLEEYRAVTIWCNRFGVNFGTATLKNREGQT